MRGVSTRRERNKQSMMEKTDMINTVVELSTHKFGPRTKERILKKKEFDLTIRPKALPPLGGREGEET